MKLNKIQEIKNLTLSHSEQENDHLNFLKELENPSELIDNVETEMFALKIDQNFLPVTINFQEYNTSYVCSVYTAFVSYAKSELLKINSKILRKILSGMIKIFDLIFKKIKIDQIISHNNFLISTNLYPEININESEFTTYLESLKSQFPNHAFIFRSLNDHSNSDLIQKLKNLGFILYPSRQVYIFDKKKNDFSKTKNFKADLKLLKEQKDFKFVSNSEIKEEDYSRIAELYNKLYIQKYSIYNPQYNEKYIKLTHQKKLIEYFGLRNNNGILDGIVGCYDRGNITTTPIVGYETDLSQKIGLYRMLMAFCINRADLKNLILNLSSGASGFKILRGGIPYIEYSAAYIGHLKLLPKIIWKSLSYLLRYIIVPIMKIYKL